MYAYFKLAEKRYRQYLWQKQRESLTQQLATLVLHIFEALVAALQDTGIIKTRRVQKVNVE
jgi:predicted  nucleic acid-binding Zn-ribbon protein